MTDLLELEEIARIRAKVFSGEDARLLTIDLVDAPSKDVARHASLTRVVGQMLLFYREQVAASAREKGARVSAARKSLVEELGKLSTLNPAQIALALFGEEEERQPTVRAKRQ